MANKAKNDSALDIIGGIAAGLIMIRQSKKLMCEKPPKDDRFTFKPHDPVPDTLTREEYERRKQTISRENGINGILVACGIFIPLGCLFMAYMMFFVDIPLYPDLTVGFVVFGVLFLLGALLAIPLFLLLGLSGLRGNREEKRKLDEVFARSGTQETAFSPAQEETPAVSPAPDDVPDDVPDDAPDDAPDPASEPLPTEAALPAETQAKLSLLRELYDSGTLTREDFDRTYAILLREAGRWDRP